MKIVKWVHPKTGEVRIYFNGITPYGVKAFAVQDGEHFMVKISSEVPRGRDLNDMLISEIGDELDKLTAKPIRTWEELINLAA